MAFPVVSGISTNVTAYVETNYLEQSLKPIPSHEPVLDAVFDRPAHIDGTEVVEVESSDESAPSCVVWGFDCK